MSKDRDHLIEKISKSSFELSPEERESFIDDSCGDDLELKSAVIDRIEQYKRAKEYFGDLADRLGLGGLADAKFTVFEGQTFGKYKIEKQIGQGGMGMVYKASDTHLGRSVALKFLSARYADDDYANERFIREARAAAALNHPNILTVHDVIDYNGLSVIVMEYIEGQTLRQKLKETPLAIEKVIDYTSQIASGLAAAHEKGIVHRDLKPGNIMEEERGTIKILDFGLARLRDASLLTKEGTRMGTVSYMSPEQAKGDKTDNRADIWSFGVIVYEMLTGERPFKGEYEQAIMYSIISEEPAPVMSLREEVPIEVANSVHKMLSKDPQDRYQNVNDIITEISGFSRRKVSPVSSIASNRSPKTSSRSQWAIVGGFVGLLILALSLWWVNQQASLNIAKTADTPKLAVLPLENLSEGTESYFAAGMTEELISTLSKIEGLGVIPRRTVMQSQITEATFDEIAEKLGVDYIVDGSVLLDDGQVRINAQLIGSNHDEAIWTERFSRTANEIIALQQDVALDIAQAIQVEVTPQDEFRIGDARPVKEEAMLLYHRGLMANDLGDRLAAIDFFERAIEEDSMFARPYAAITIPYFVTGQGEKGKIAASKAIELDERATEAYIAKAIVLLYTEHNIISAMEHIEHALSISPNDLQLNHEYAVFLARMGKHEEALDAAIRSLELNPHSKDARAILAWQLYYNHRYEGATEYAEEFYLEGDWFTGMLFIDALAYSKNSDQIGEVIQELEYKLVSATESDRKELLKKLGKAYAHAGRDAEAREILERIEPLIGLPDTDCSDWDLIKASAAISHLIGDEQKAFYWLDRAVRSCSKEGFNVLAMPFYDSIREDSRFKALKEIVRESIGLES